MPSERVHDSLEIANYLIERAAQAGSPIDPLQLMKLVYICHGWTLGLLESPLLEDDVEAWQYGPVIRRLYKYVRGRREPLQTPLTDARPNLSDHQKIICNQVLEKYGRFSGVALSRLTHQPGTPWDTTWKAYGKNAVIPQETIKQHFRELSERHRNVGGQQV